MSPQPAAFAAGLAPMGAAGGTRTAASKDGQVTGFQQCLEQSGPGSPKSPVASARQAPVSSESGEAKAESGVVADPESVASSARPKPGMTHLKAAQSQASAVELMTDPKADHLLSLLLQSLSPSCASTADQSASSGEVPAGDEHADDAESTGSADSVNTASAMVIALLAAPPPPLAPEKTSASDPPLDSDSSIAGQLLSAAEPAQKISSSLPATPADAIGQAPLPLPILTSSTPEIAALAPTTPTLPTSPAATAAFTSPPSLMPAPAAGHWAPPLVEHIVWLASDTGANAQHGIREARIDLHPAEWGSLQIRVQLDDEGRTRVSFDVETPQARAAIESSLPQLRDLLTTQSVNAPTPRFELSGGLSQQPRPTPAPSSRSTGSRDEADEPITPTRLRSGSGLIDQFA